MSTKRFCIGLTRKKKKKSDREDPRSQNRSLKKGLGPNKLNLNNVFLAFLSIIVFTYLITLCQIIRLTSTLCADIADFVSSTVQF